MSASVGPLEMTHTPIPTRKVMYWLNPHFVEGNREEISLALWNALCDNMFGPIRPYIRPSSHVGYQAISYISRNHKDKCGRPINHILVQIMLDGKVYLYDNDLTCYGMAADLNELLKGLTYVYGKHQRPFVYDMKPTVQVVAHSAGAAASAAVISVPAPASHVEVVCAAAAAPSPSVAINVAGAESSEISMDPMEVLSSAASLCEPMPTKSV